jgi:DNA sulfur modification protein DndD
VRRQWSFQKDSPREYLSVYVDGSDHPDLSLSENWDQEIERLLPARLAELFFFDGERIEKLADPLKSAEVLKAAVSSLLGLDLVDHLVADLEILRSRQKQRLLSEGEQAKFQSIEAIQAAIAQELEDVRDKKGRCTLRLDQATRDCERIQLVLKGQGGDRFQRREDLAKDKARASAELAGLERDLRDLAARCLPLILVQPRLRLIAQEVSAKAQGATPEALELVQHHLGRLGAWIADQRFSRTVHRQLKQRLEAEVASLRASEPIAEGFDWRQLRAHLSTLTGQRLEAARSAAISRIAEIRKLTDRLHELDEQLAHIPEQEQLANLFRKQGAAEAALDEAKRELSSLEAAERALLHRLEGAKRQRLEQLNKVIEADDASRLTDYCEKSIGTLGRFRANLIRMRREQLEGLILEAFQVLSHKADLIAHVELDPETMAISLKSNGGADVATQQLSAGERQLLAIAMLWALARATGRPVPVVIDTPLGRLDGEHRRTLVERYFPDAGHQVILLSTDTEVDANFSDLLDDSVAHRYLIGYDAKSSSSSFVSGYFRRQ